MVNEIRCSTTCFMSMQAISLSAMAVRVADADRICAILDNPSAPQSQNPAHHWTIQPPDPIRTVTQFVGLDIAAATKHHEPQGFHRSQGRMSGPHSANTIGAPMARYHSTNSRNCLH